MYANCLSYYYFFHFRYKYSHRRPQVRFLSIRKKNLLSLTRIEPLFLYPKTYELDTTPAELSQAFLGITHLARDTLSVRIVRFSVCSSLSPYFICLLRSIGFINCSFSGGSIVCICTPHPLTAGFS